MVSAYTIAEASAQLLERHFQLVLLDLNLPDGQGFEVCKIIREELKLSTLPILFISGSMDIEKKVQAFSLGADDYIVKPFDRRELMARIQARLQKAEEKECIEVENLKLNIPLQKATCSASNYSEKELDLTPIEFKLLFFFIKNPGHVFSREQLKTTIWSHSQKVVDRTIDTHISNLKKKLAQGESRVTIKAIHGSGYHCAIGQPSGPLAKDPREE